jgi:uncharacterized protein (DUF58 family)
VTSPKLRRASRGKEAVLLFLAAFYFLIATNTQSGWLFLLSAFLLGILALCWLPPRRAARQTTLSRELLGSPQRGVPLLVRLRLTNSGTSVLREVLVIEPANPWSAEAREFRWVVPRLAPGESVSAEYTVTPHHRGEHSLAPSILSFGAPFGLFTVHSIQPESEKFLVYPRLLTLSPRRQRTRLAGILTDFTSPRSKGDSRSLRSLREYQAGDDLRLVHWKSSAKNGGSALLVREHHAPSRQLSLLLLDTSERPAVPASDSFERAVMLAASLLWSAHRAGTRSTLLLHADQGWQRLNRWEEQYSALARVTQCAGLTFSRWLTDAAQLSTSDHPDSRTGAHPFLITSADSPQDLGQPSDWPGPAAGAVLLLTAPENSGLFADYPVTLVDVDEGHASEAISHV